MARRPKGEEDDTPVNDLPVSPNKPEPLSLAREITVILLATATLLTLLSLISYHPYDHGALSFGTVAMRPENWVGILGAYWSYLLVHALGLVSLWLPLLPWLSDSLFP